MNIQIHSIHFDADKKLIDLITKKVEKLNHFFDAIIGSEVFLKIDKASTAENKVVEIKLNVPGNDLFVKRQCESFESAADECTEALRNQLTKRKEKTKRSLSGRKESVKFSV
ncbi:MAG: ribosome-associated translation inhibitor RaiA [Bacteroidetes bacterium]|nr:MAG: ribosome-associated translation inhibitor RaiA [Bacteroidota bacterium]